jgi:hypothetical protein
MEMRFMKVSMFVIVLSLVVAVFSAAAAGAGLFIKDGGKPYPFTTLRGQTVQVWGQGLYRFDSVFFSAGFKGQDAVALFLGVPLLFLAIFLYQRGSLSGHLLLVGVLGYFLYLYASMALGAQYNRMFLVYILIFSASLFAIIQAFSSVDKQLIANKIPAGLPVNSLAIFMFMAGAITLFVWGAPIVSALLKGSTLDRMDHYTTMVTYALDLAIITPATILCGYLVLRGDPLGYVIASPLLTLIVILAPQIILSTVFQKAAGVPFTPGEMIGPISGFVILGFVALWLLIRILQVVSKVVV